MTNAPEICACCKEPIQSASFASNGVGQVCRECAGNLRKAVVELAKHRMQHLFIGDCPDNRKGGGK